MTNTTLIDSYYKWMISKIMDTPNGKQYGRLLDTLFSERFVYIFARDANRFEDGINLRYRFGEETNTPAPVIASELDNRDCSILEMMVALSLRCEETLMHDDDCGDRTHVWFWDMVCSLGLFGMDDAHFDSYEVRDIISAFLDRRYSSNGKGGLFTVECYDGDLASLEIWAQLHLYLNNILDIEEGNKMPTIKRMLKE